LRLPADFAYAPAAHGDNAEFDEMVDNFYYRWGTYPGLPADIVPENLFRGSD
jgi:hypothetical protein